MKKINIIFFVTTAFLFLHYGSKTEAAVSNDEYEVYSAVLSQISQPAQGKDVFVIRGSTILGDEQCSERQKKYFKTIFKEGISEDLIIAFLDLKDKQGSLQGNFNRQLKVVSLAQSQKDKMFKGRKDGWEKFSEKYPDSDGINEFSRVAFDKNKTRALLYYGKIFDSGKAQVGCYLLMAKEGGRWFIVQRHDLDYKRFHIEP